jgi:hypothetical protein
MGSLLMFRLGNLTSREAWDSSSSLTISLTPHDLRQAQSTELTGGRFFPSSGFYELLSQTQHPIGPHCQGGFLKTLSNITNGCWSSYPASIIPRSNSTPPGSEIPYSRALAPFTGIAG